MNIHEKVRRQPCTIPNCLTWMVRDFADVSDVGIDQRGDDDDDSEAYIEAHREANRVTAEWHDTRKRKTLLMTMSREAWSCMVDEFDALADRDLYCETDADERALRQAIRKERKAIEEFIATHGIKRLPF